MILSKYLIYLLPFALVTGPLLSETIIIFVSLNFMFISFKNKLTYYYLNRFAKIFFSFFIIINFSSLMSDNVIYSLKTSVPYIRYFFFIIAFSYLVKIQKDFTLNFFYILLITLSVVATSGFLEFFFDMTFSLKTNYIKHLSRVSGFFGDELIIGSYLSKLMSLFFLLLIILKKKNLLYFLISFFIFFAVLISGERTSTLVAAISLLFFIFFSNINYKKKFLYLFSVLFIGSILIFSNPLLKNRIFTETKNQMYYQKELQYFSKEHSAHYQTALKMFIDKPLLGHGPRSFRIICKDKKYYNNSYSCSTHPHNFLLQLLAETGLLGSIFFVSVFIFSIYILSKNIILKNPEKIYFIFPVIIFTLPFITSGNFFNNWLSIINYLSISFSLHFLLINEKKN